MTNFMDFDPRYRKAQSKQYEMTPRQFIDHILDSAGAVQYVEAVTYNFSGGRYKYGAYYINRSE